MSRNFGKCIHLFFMMQLSKLQNEIWCRSYRNITLKHIYLPPMTWEHYSTVIMKATVSQITGLTIVYSGADQRKHQRSASVPFVRGIHWWSVNSPHKGSVTRKMFPFDDVIMSCAISTGYVSVYSIFCSAIVLAKLKSHWNIPTPN